MADQKKSKWVDIRQKKNQIKFINIYKQNNINNKIYGQILNNSQFKRCKNSGIQLKTGRNFTLTNDYNR